MLPDRFASVRESKLPRSSQRWLSITLKIAVVSPGEANQVGLAIVIVCLGETPPQLMIW